MKEYITVIGAGLAGCEAAYQIAKAGIKVKLYEMKPIKYSEAHSNENLAEIVCSNSFKSNLFLPKLDPHCLLYESDYSLFMT